MSEAVVRRYLVLHLADVLDGSRGLVEPYWVYGAIVYASHPRKAALEVAPGDGARLFVVGIDKAITYAQGRCYEIEDGRCTPLAPWSIRFGS